MYVDYCDLLDELLVLSRREDLEKYRKKLKYYARIQILFDRKLQYQVEHFIC